MRQVSPGMSALSRVEPLEEFVSDVATFAGTGLFEGRLTGGSGAEKSEDTTTGGRGDGAGTPDDTTTGGSGDDAAITGAAGSGTGVATLTGYD